MGRQQRQGVARVSAERRQRFAPFALGTLIAATAGVGGALFFFVVRDLAPVDDHVRLTWWMLAIAFAVAELCVVHAHVRGSAHSLSLSELPLVLGLLLAHPQDVVIGQ